MKDLDCPKRLPDPEARLSWLLVEVIIGDIEGVEGTFLPSGVYPLGLERRRCLHVLIALHQVRRDSPRIPDNLPHPLSIVQERVARREEIRFVLVIDGPEPLVTETPV